MTNRTEDDQRTGSIAGWHERIAEAQQQKTETISGETYKRVPYGDEHANSAFECRDCMTEVGMLHVVGCCVERCARCGGQRISCLCHEGH